MANKVTGKTDTSGALTTAPVSVKSIVVMGKAGSDATATDINANELFSITGTADAVTAFGATSKIPAMVRVLISNGVDNIVGMVIDGGTEGTEIATALEASMSDKTIKVVLLDTNDTATIAAVKDHLTVCEANDMFRYSVFAPNDDDTVSQTKLTAFAASIASDRIFVPGPGLLQSSGRAVPQLVATGLAALIMTETSDPALPMNGVQIAGFTGVSRTLLETEMKALAMAGVTPIYMEGATPAVYRLVTSVAATNNVWLEGTTRFIADYVLESNEELLRANYKRTKNVVRILNAIKGDIKINMEKMESLEIIENWDESTLTVVKDPMDAYGALIDYEFDVVTPLYTITINQHMKI